jgi:hypothetical protein
MVLGIEGVQSIAALLLYCPLASAQSGEEQIWRLVKVSLIRERDLTRDKERDQISTRPLLSPAL